MFKRIMSFYKKLPITIRAAIIGGIFTIVASFITLWGNNPSPLIQIGEISIIHSNYPAGPASSVNAPAPTLENLPTIPSVATQQPQTQNGFKRYAIPEGGQTIIYSENAPITIVGFGDFECPFTRKWNNEVLPKLVEHYPGQIRYIFRDLPLGSIHPNAFSAAIAANCGGEQGYYRSFYDKLLSGKYELNINSYLQIASETGSVVGSTFEKCVNSERQNNKVTNESDFAIELGVQSTPTFFINGIPLIGAQPFEIFQDVIDKELAGEFPK